MQYLEIQFNSTLTFLITRQSLLLKGIHHIADSIQETIHISESDFEKLL